MAAYIIADVDVKDAAGFDEYRTLVPATLTPYGGKFAVRGGKLEALEGTWAPKRLVVLEFPSLDHARRWYDGPEYKNPQAMRFKTAMTNLILVEGV